jgi:hypothetical protein
MQPGRRAHGCAAESVAAVLTPLRPAPPPPPAPPPVPDNGAAEGMEVSS